MPKGTVVTEQGKKMKLAPKVEAGLVPCPGEAHENAYIDHCGICKPRWGQMMTYEPPTVESVLEGFAVPCSFTAYTGRSVFENAEKEGKIKRVHATEKYSGCQSMYFVWVKA